VSSDTYYPRCKVRLIVRFDEFSDPNVADDASKLKPPHLINGIKDDRDVPLKAVPDPLMPGRFLLQQPNKPAKSVGPQQQDKSKDDLTQVVGGIVPTSASWVQAGIRSCDTLEFKIKLLDFPCDPRCIRSIGVQFYLGCLAQSELGSGTVGQLITDEWVDDSGQQRTNLRFEGFADDIEVELPEDGEGVVTFHCRDNTALLIDAHAPPKGSVSPTKPIHQAVADYLANFPQFAGLTVEYLPAGSNVPKLENVLARTANRPNLGPPASKGGGGDSKLSVWDYLTDVAGAIGHSIRVVGTRIIIQRVRTLTSRAFPKRQDDPYSPGLLYPKYQGRALPHRTFIYGRNVKSLKVRRTFTKKAPTSIEVRCFLPKRGQVLVVRFPEKADRATFSLPGDEGHEQKWMIVRVSGIEDKETLRTIAQNQYESIGRNEITVTIKTKELTSFGGDGADPNLFDMRAGDTFDFFVARDDYYNSFTAVEDVQNSAARMTQYMMALGFDRSFAAAYARSYTNAGFQTAFRFKSGTFTWSTTEAVTVEIQGVNYVETRVDKPLPDAEAEAKGPTPKASQK